jgi:hypothetical protein
MWSLAAVGISGRIRQSNVRLPLGFLARIARPVDLRGDSLGPPDAVQNDSFEFFSRFAATSFEWNRFVGGKAPIDLEVRQKIGI